MNRHSGLVLLGMMIFLISGFTTLRQPNDFKKDKANLNKLTIFNPFVRIVANNNSEPFFDSTLTSVNQRLMDSITHKLLTKKYAVERAVLPLTDYDSFTDLFDQLENSPKKTLNISSKPLFNKTDVEFNTKYALLLIYYGQYHPDFPPHFKLTAAATGTVIFTPGNPTNAVSDLRLLVIDTENEKIVYHDRINTSKYDARVTNDVRQMTRTILRKIYYK
jgi:hypothetical protein